MLCLYNGGGGGGQYTSDVEYIVPRVGVLYQRQIICLREYVL